MPRTPKNYADLTGIRALVTRPHARAAELCARIEKLGGEAVQFPVIEISAPHDTNALAKAVAQLRRGDVAIFISVEAVEGAVTCMQRLGLRMPHGVHVGVVGEKTAQACTRAGMKAEFVARALGGSENLLDEMRDFDVGGKNAFIFRGQSGREYFRRAMKSRGANVRYVESYRRVLSKIPAEPLLQRMRAREIDAVLVTAASLWDALWSRCATAENLLGAIPVFAYSARIAEHCKRTGARETYAAARASDAALVAALAAWAREKRRAHA